MAGFGLDAGFINILIGPKLMQDFAKTLGIDISNETGPLAESLGKEFGQKMGKGITKVGATLTASLTAPIVALGALTINSAMKMDEALDSVRTKTGLTGKEFDNLSESIKNVYKQVPTSIGNVADIMSDISIKTGLAGKDLEALGIKFAQFGKITGQDINVKDTLDAFTKLGVTQKDYGKSLDGVLKASQFAGVGVEQFTNTIKSQSPVLNELGINFETSLGLLASFEKAGVDSGAMLNAFKRSILTTAGASGDLIKSQDELAKVTSQYEKTQLDAQVAQAKLNAERNNSKSTYASVLEAENKYKAVQMELSDLFNQRIALQDKIKQSQTAATQGDAGATLNATLQQLKALQDSGKAAEAQTLAFEKFGKTGLTVLDAIRNGAINVSSAIKEIGNNTNTIESIYSANLDFSDQLVIFKNRLDTTFGELGTKLFPTIERVLDIIIPLVEKFLGFFENLPGPVQSAIVIFLGLLAAVGPILTTIGGIITALTVIGPVIAGVGAAFAGLALPILAITAVIVGLGFVVYDIIKNWEEWKTFFIGLWDGIKETVSSFIDWFTEKWKGITDGIGDAITTAIEGIKQTIETIKSFITNKINDIKNTFISVGTALIQPFITFSNKLKEIFNAIPNFFIELKNTIVNTFISLKASLINFLNSITNLPGFKQLLGVLGAIGGVVAKAIPGRAIGGPVSANTPYIVGERGPEVIVPKTSGTVIPNNAIGSIGSSNYNIVINNPISEPASITIPNALRRVAYLKEGI